MHALDNRRNVVVGKFRVLEGKTTLYRIDLCPLFLRHPATIDKELDSRWEVTGFSLGNRTAAPEIGPPRGEQGGPINYSDAEYSGAGSASMLGAASAWKGVAAELRSTALSYGAVLSALTDEEWQGPASTAMADAAAPYVAWMNTTAVQAEQAASQAEAAAAAYETAFAATVPPPEIAANRAQLVSLVSTNFLGLNTPAIAATEAQYGEMWSQDATAMYGYAGSSAVASQLTMFAPPQPIVNPAGPPAQSAAVSQAAATSAGTGQSTVSQLMSAVPGTLQSLAAPVSTPQAAAPAPLVAVPWTIS